MAGQCSWRGWKSSSGERRRGRFAEAAPMPNPFEVVPTLVKRLKHPRHHATYHDRQSIGWHCRGPSLKPPQGAGARTSTSEHKEAGLFSRTQLKPLSFWPRTPAFYTASHVKRQAEMSRQEVRRRGLEDFRLNSVQAALLVGVLRAVSDWDAILLPRIQHI